VVVRADPSADLHRVDGDVESGALGQDIFGCALELAAGALSGALLLPNIAMDISKLGKSSD
jgi:hypothetical protein